MDAAAVLCLGAVCDRVSVVAGFSAARGGDHHAVNGPIGAHQLFPASRPRREWSAGIHQWRWEPDLLAAPVLVFLGSLRFRAYFFPLRNRRRKFWGKFSQAPLGVPIIGVFLAGGLVFVGFSGGASTWDFWAGA